MFEILFGWRKASKCKKLIRRVQCRLKLLKNKRCSIVRQLRDDVAYLIRYGHDQSAFDRVEQLFKDESIVLVYELLDNFCEFILIHLSYIRRHKDCPNDINEAVSSLIFASARCGDLPELPLIRKLFGERYGQRFAVVALELLPGNLVNRQIRENLSIKSVSNEAKYKLVDEIARSCLPLAPLALEYHQEHQPAYKSNGDQELNSDVKMSCAKSEESQVEAEGKIALVDIKRSEEMEEDSSSEGSFHMQEEMIYLDDIEEFQSPTSKDQRLFVFKSTVLLGKENGKRLRESAFDTNRIVGELPKGNFKSNHPRKHHKKAEVDDSRKKVNVDRPYYASTNNGSLNGKLNTKKMCDNMVREYEGETRDFLGNGADSIRRDDKMEIKENKYPYLRVVTMPIERPKDSESDNILRSNSFPVKCSSPHVHPKLPDYDELAAKFMALKKANLEKNRI